jgi:lysophospholipase L1-like esterase
MFSTDEATLPGVQPGSKAFTTNNVGLRGPDLPSRDDGDFKIITVGGSTTECIFLNDTEEWPSLLMSGLNAGRSGRRVWLGNAGVSGHTAVEHLAMLQTIPVLRRADLLIFMIGINDLQDHLAFRGASTQAELERGTRSMVASWQGGLDLNPLFRRTRIYQAARRAIFALKLSNRLINARAADWYVGNRRRRADGRVLPLPDLTLGLTEYRKRLERIFAACRNQNHRCLFLTQPTMWRGDLTAEEQRLQWFGWIGFGEKPDGYVSPSDLTRAMELYNKTLLEACAQSGMECFDLAAVIPKDTSTMFDDCHFNENGARLVAQTLSRYLLAHPPFSTGQETPAH